MTAPSDHRTGLSFAGILLVATGNLFVLAGFLLGYSGVLTGIMLAIDAAYLAFIAYVVRAHNRALQSVSTDQAGEGV